MVSGIEDILIPCSCLSSTTMNKQMFNYFVYFALYHRPPNRNGEVEVVIPFFKQPSTKVGKCFIYLINTSLYKHMN